jgi:alpha-glucosidase
MLLGFNGPLMATQQGVVRRVFSEPSINQVIKIEWLSDGLIHFEFAHGLARKSLDPIYVSPLILPQEHLGPTVFYDAGSAFTTAETRTEYKSGCFTVTDRSAKRLLTRVCAPDLSHEWKRLSFETSGVRNIYGLGQMFETAGDTTLDRNGKVIATKGGFGNSMPSYAGGATGEAMFPVVTALGSGKESWGLVVDNIYKQTWDFTKPTWSVGMFGDQIRGFIISGKDPADVRQRFMKLSGKAPVPPRKMFGFWMSEYGYDNWDEINDRLSGMRRSGFPIDGFFLDLQWFGNVAPGSDHTRMGTLEFDERNFPDARGQIQNYLTKEDIGLVTIEESYVGRALSEHDDLESRGFLAHECGHPNTASYMTGEVTGNTSEWWGRGGMIDWSHPEAGRYWHLNKRQKLINMGIFAHWLDLGEPEMFDPSSCYHGAGELGKTAHQDVHNVFSLLWAKSLSDGFAENHVGHRPFAMLRSGNIGLQRFGAGLWSGDIGGNLPSLASHITNHNHVSWSGIDYYSSDIGGFHRNRADGRPLSHAETQENFTQWFANATWFDVPVRSHVMNLDNDRDTAPNRIGHVESNRINLLTRYSMIPYYYSLAHRAAYTGMPLMEPMAMRFPEDMSLRTIGTQRMLGDLMITAAAETSIYATDVRLPRGLWYDFVDGKHQKSDGISLQGYPTYRDGVFRLPVFAKAGAIVPRYAGMMNQKALGVANVVNLSRNMMLDVYASDDETMSSFDLVEDEGYTRDYEAGAVRVTHVEQVTTDLTTNVTIAGSVGTFAGAADERAWTVRIWSPGWTPAAVTIDGKLVPVCDGGVSSRSLTCYERIFDGAVLVRMASGDTRVNHNIAVQWTIGAPDKASVHVVCDEGRDAPRGYGMFVVGDDPQLGAWNPAKALPLKAAEYARGVWTSFIRGVPAGVSLEWKCLRKLPGGGDRNIEWQPGTNNVTTTPAEGGFAGMAKARW